MDGTDVHLFFSNIFTNAEYNGSTLEIQGADRFSLNHREVSVVSGTRAFRFVKGNVVLTTVFFRNPNAVVQCNATIRHYEWLSSYGDGPLIWNSTRLHSTRLHSTWLELAELIQLKRVSSHFSSLMLSNCSSRAVECISMQRVEAITVCHTFSFFGFMMWAVNIIWIYCLLERDEFLGSSQSIVLLKLKSPLSA